jgi:8-oxo-dGTP pyrophosphatase MutT (NUDIX family)
MELYDDAVLTPSGAPGFFTRFRYRGNPPGVVCVPRLPDGRYVLIEAYRYAFDTLSLEFPRGTAEPGEAAPVAAQRELLEETNLTAAATSSLGFLRPDTSIVETEAEIFLLDVPSTDRIAVDQETEGIAAYQLLSFQQLAAAIRDHTIRDGFTLGAFSLLAASTLA